MNCLVDANLQDIEYTLKKEKIPNLTTTTLAANNAACLLSKGSVLEKYNEIKVAAIKNIASESKIIKNFVR